MKLYITVLRLLFFFILINSACVPYNKLRYFTDIEQLKEPSINSKSDKTILPFDRIYIKVYSIDEKTNQLFNASDNMMSGVGTGIIGNLVDSEGDIDYPFVGKINVLGLTITQAGKKIEEALGQYVSNAAVSVKFIDNHVTVLGQVQQQGVFLFSADKINIYEALALGGGLTQYGDRRNVILIRQENGKIMHHKLNLSDSRISDKDYYYVLANDVIVVEPLRNISYNYGNNTFSIILSSITALITIFVFLGIGIK